MRVWICDKSYTIKNSIRSAEHDVCVWIYDKTFTIKNAMRSAEHDVCVWIYDKTIIIKKCIAECVARLVCLDIR